MATRALRARELAIALVAAALTFTMAACGGDNDDLPPPAAPPTETPDAAIELTAEEQEMVEGAQAIFDTFMAAYIEDATTGESLETEMGPVVGGRAIEHLTGPVASLVQFELAENRNENRLFAGDLTWELIEVIEVNLDRMVRETNVPEAVIHYCMDATDWVLVDRDSGEPLAEPQGRWLASVEAVRTGEDGDHAWFVTAWDELEGESC